MDPYLEGLLALPVEFEIRCSGTVRSQAVAGIHLFQALDHLSGFGVHRLFEGCRRSCQRAFAATVKPDAAVQIPVAIAIEQGFIRFLAKPAAAAVEHPDIPFQGLFPDALFDTAGQHSVEQLAAQG